MVEIVAHGDEIKALCQEAPNFLRPELERAEQDVTLLCIQHKRGDRLLQLPAMPRDLSVIGSHTLRGIICIRDNAHGEEYISGKVKL
eukprot:SAG11_NODE_2252_length_3631_cov_2.469706_4_plen_87_part_00